MDLFYSFILLWQLLNISTDCFARTINYTPVDWNKQAQQSLREALSLSQNSNVAKNVVFFLGDGMGVSTVMAARVYKGQLEGRPGEEEELHFETFPHVALSKTYNADYQVPDSAGTATAFLCGVKANMGTVGVMEGISYDTPSDCKFILQNTAPSLVRMSQLAGKTTGIVSTARITHATPAVTYAQSPNRNWEGGFDGLEEEAEREGCQDIAHQLVHGETGKNLNVIFGGGRSKFTSTNDSDPEYPEQTGSRIDGRNLIEEWLSAKEESGSSYKYVWNKDQFDEIDPETKHVMGLFEPSHMKYDLDIAEDEGGEPCISQMTRKAIEILKKNDKDDKGFFLLVEGGRIDHAHHKGLAKKALADTLAMDWAVKVALEITSEDDTLVIVTADHSHVFTVGGYPTRGNPILGLVGNTFTTPLDGLPYTTLGYTNGPGGILPGENRQNLSQVDTNDKNYVQQSLVPLKSETHGGEDVAIYARGPMAHLFHGVHEQNYIAHVMAYASCVGDNKEHCEKNESDRGNSGAGASYPYVVLTLCICLLGTTIYVGV